MSGSHRCPIDGCERRVPSYQLMCPRHWRAVPADVQRRLYRTWDHGRGAGTEDHIEAMDAAIHAAEVDAR
jgi:hypothetical protein